MTAARVCTEPGCPTLVPAASAYRGRCDPHRKQWDQQRGTTTQRGYGANHQQERAAWQRRINTGELILCWRCGEQIQQGDGWHLGHDDVDRSITRGPNTTGAATSAPPDERNTPRGGAPAPCAG